jgi:hypothetical protein
MLDWGFRRQRGRQRSRNIVIPFREFEVDLPEDLEIPTPDSKAAHLKYDYSVQAHSVKPPYFRTGDIIARVGSCAPELYYSVQGV